MGLFDFLAKQVVCPSCGSRGAIQGIFGAVRCPEISCRHYDFGLESALRQQGTLPAPGSAERPQRTTASSRHYRNPRTGESDPAQRPLQGDFHPGQHAIEVRYTNFRGEENTYLGDRRTIRRTGNHLSLALAPTGQRITFTLDRLHNRAELLDCAVEVPSPSQQQVMKFHARRGTTSELYEQLRRRFPNWSPET